MLVEVERLAKAYGRKRVLEAVDLVVEPGEVVALAGRNGVGKTTLLNILMGLLLPDGGRVRVLGEEPARRRHLDRTAWMPERPEFPRRWRVRELIRFQAESFPGWHQARCDELCERMSIDLEARSESLSRGQKARLGLLLALATEPRLLLLDDPTLGLDPATRRLLLGQLLADAAERGTGVLVSTHLLAEFDAALDRLLILEEGRITVAESVGELKGSYRRLVLPTTASGPPPELAARPVDGWFLSTRWDESAWEGYRSQHPGARAEPIGVEEIFIALTGGAS